MGRVSLTEAYDDRSVISKLNEMDKRVTENTTVVTSAEASAKASAQAAQETADRFAGSVGAVVQNANAQINASKAQVDQAKAEVDETVTTVAQAVQTANDASASAQQSAQTVAGYDTRLTAVETKNTQQDTDITALQTADTNNVKLNYDTKQTMKGPLSLGAKNLIVESIYNTASDTGIKQKVGFTINPSSQKYADVGIISDADDKSVVINRVSFTNADTIDKVIMKSPNGTNHDMVALISKDNSQYLTIPSVPSDAPSTVIVNKAYVESTDGATNNLVHRTSAENINGVKSFIDGIVMHRMKFDRTALPTSYDVQEITRLTDKNNQYLVSWVLVYNAGTTARNHAYLQVRFYQSDGSFKTVTIAEAEVD